MQFASTPIFALLLTSLVSINGSPLPALINNELSPSSSKTFNPQHSSHGGGSHGPLQIVTRNSDFKLHIPKNRNSTKNAGSSKHFNHTTIAGSKKVTTRAAVKLPKPLEKLAKLFSRDSVIQFRSTGIQLNSTHPHHNGTKATGRHNNTTKATGRHNSTSKANLKSHSNHTSKAGSKVSERAAVKLPKILEKIAKLSSRSIDSPNTYPETKLSTRAAVHLPKLLEKLAKLFSRSIAEEDTLSTRAAVHLPSWLSNLAKFFRRDVASESTTSVKLNATRAHAHAHSHENRTKSVKFAGKYAAREIVDLQEREGC